METYVAIDNVCAWPNLKLLPDGDVLAFLFNRPSHGREEGDVECWASRDGGVFWERRNVVTHHEPGTNRMNHAVGLNRRGELIVAVSGWKLPLPNTQDRADSLMPAYVYGSADGGRTWAHLSTLPTLGGAHTIPFGDIVTLPDGVLAMSVYGPVKGQDGVLRNQCSVFFSPDDGRTWGAPALLGMDRNETVLLALGGDRLIAAARTYIPWEATPPGTGNWGLDQHIALHTSKDAGRTWRDEGALTLPGSTRAGSSGWPTGASCWSMACATPATMAWQRALARPTGAHGDRPCTSRALRAAPTGAIPPACSWPMGPSSRPTMPTGRPRTSAIRWA